MSNRQKIRVGWLNIIEKHSSNPRTKDLLCPSSEDFVSSRTLTKCGPKNAPLIGGLCHAADFDQMWSEMCPSSEDFVSSRTSTKCGPIMCPSLEDFVTLRTFDQIWSIIHPSLEDFVASRTFLTNSSRSTNIQVKTNSLFDRPEPLKGSSFAEKHHMTQALTKKWHNSFPCKLIDQWRGSRTPITTKQYSII